MNKKIPNLDNLKQIREKKGITQIKLSVDVEVSQELISQYELGKSKPTIDTLSKLADYFNCSTDFLLGRTNNPENIKELSKQELDDLDIINQYKSLSNENKKHLVSYLTHLLNNNQ